MQLAWQGELNLSACSDILYWGGPGGVFYVHWHIFPVTTNSLRILSEKHDTKQSSEQKKTGRKISFISELGPLAEMKNQKSQLQLTDLVKQ